jgi:hypothetical protein
MEEWRREPPFFNSSSEPTSLPWLWGTRDPVRREGERPTSKDIDPDVVPFAATTDPRMGA